MTREEKNKPKQQELTKLDRQEKWKKRLLITFKIIFTFLFITFSFLLYARYIATSGLIIKEEKIESNTLPTSFHGFKIIHFTDLHYGSTIFLDELENLVDQINKRNPDLVVFTGDFIDRSYQIKDEKEKEEIVKQLLKIHSTVGKYAVTGNHDYETDDFNTILTKSNFHILDNDYDLIYYQDLEPILLVGLNSSIKGHLDIEKAFNYFQTENSKQDIYTITLLHEPDTIDSILQTHKTDLALAGHSHNGQVRLPFYGSIIKVKGARKYSEEYYKIKNTDLFISGGIGTSDYPIRLFNRPSINFFRLNKIK